MEEAPRSRRVPLFAALAGMLLLAAMWATMALAGGSAPAAKPTKAPAAKAQVSKGKAQYAGKHDGEQCPGDRGDASRL